MKSHPKKFFKSVKPQAVILATKSYKFPNISRIIPENVFSRIFGNTVFLTAFCCGFVLMAIAIVGFNLNINLVKLNAVKQERSKIATQINYWKSFTDKYKGYRDGYYQLAVLEYQIGENRLALDYLGKTLEIDPNFNQADELIKRIKE
jgi:hypothetical protein